MRAVPAFRLTALTRSRILRRFRPGARCDPQPLNRNQCQRPCDADEPPGEFVPYVKALLIDSLSEIQDPFRQSTPTPDPIAVPRLYKGVSSCAICTPSNSTRFSSEERRDWLRPPQKMDIPTDC